MMFLSCSKGLSIRYVHNFSPWGYNIGGNRRNTRVGRLHIIHRYGYMNILLLGFQQYRIVWRNDCNFVITARYNLLSNTCTEQGPIWAQASEKTSLLKQTISQLPPQRTHTFWTCIFSSVLILSMQL